MARKIIYGYLLAFITTIFIVYPKNALAQLGEDCPSDEINTAIGCIPLGEEGLATFFLRWGIGVGGGIAFLMIVFAGFQIMASQGNPEKLKAGQELLSAAIGGLLLLIFSVFVLRFVGVTILQIPDF